MLEKAEAPNSGSNIGICTTDPVFTHVIKAKSSYQVLFSSRFDVLKTCMTLYKSGCRQIYIDGSQLDFDNLMDLSADPKIGCDRVKKIFFNANDRTHC